MRDFNKYTEYIYQLAPLYQNVGGAAYKEGLTNTLLLDGHLGHPHRQYRTIHVAGTNGKGSCSHTIASILQQQGYRVGLYTSPHLLSFTERIRVNGVPIPEDYIMDFVDREKSFFEPLHTSFFELTTAIAFRYFADEKVDYAVIEVGLGGRLDCTNIITPLTSVITNISLDHVQHLGNTIAKIAWEKAGIMKPGIPCVIGETTDESRPVFIQHAEETNTPLIFAEENQVSEDLLNDFALKGIYQRKNLRTILTTISELQRQGVEISDDSVRKGLQNVVKNTHLRGRWEILSQSPLTICDTGHNVGGIQYVVEQLKFTVYSLQFTETPASSLSSLDSRLSSQPKLRFVLGMVNDKDISGVLALLPHDAVYYFTQASVARALPAEELKDRAQSFHLQGNAYPSVSLAVQAAQRDALPTDIIFIGGSTFVVADALKNYN